MRSNGGTTKPRAAQWTLAVGCALAVAFPLAAAVHDEWTPTAPLISQVEHHLKLPDGSKPLPAYARYYYGTVQHGHRVLVGEFVSDQTQPGVHVVKPGHTPKILDGGCSVINLKYDTEKKVVIALFCDGVA